MKKAQDAMKPIDPAMLAKILGAVPSSRDDRGQGVVIPQARFESFFHS